MVTPYAASSIVRQLQVKKKVGLAGFDVGRYEKGRRRDPGVEWELVDP
jgi:hypothetical protein